MKKIALISTYCDNEEKVQILKETVFKIKEMGIDVMGISPIQLPIEVTSLCDFFFYTKENPLLGWPERMYTHWYQMPLNPNKITTIHRGFHDYGWAGLYQVKKLSQIALTFDYDIFYHMIYDLDIDETIISEIQSNEVNMVHPRVNPNHPDDIWETTLHFMVFDREMMKIIENEIQLEEYIRTNGVAEGEVLKWIQKYDIKISDVPIRDRVFYWENFDFFNLSPFDEFKLFVSKNPVINIWLGEKNPYKSVLGENLRIVFHGFEKMDVIRIIINGISYSFLPKPWEIIEIPVSSQKINSFIMEYKNQFVDFSNTYSKIMLNQVYYNHRD